ncbi:glutamine--fructose-6-phosphate transaminase (isomerizing) [Eubacterium pyruvativorans]|uniref:glutamine--fructose-6-phosphate transaminase (isomerizing) n=1 Tax=Eubacterium pyruvativorans TaxID=155865 RepID=UPI0023F4423E|nr:glutamine--fructose-6-phosphate transaminase (isomerizing) [Eubacterium pyruvativorans]MCI5747360.1 glutamine--fructose-6-phosphate transaminase (isomerizing) [Eubacterium pyruvativorans]MDD7684872.1 glutamine--fructose-6-phosphate transaminase (isomerizing) [Eubacterium pyruvativorans]
MCGIVGYTGHENAKNIVIDGLKKLEYRGYDSAGIALLGDGTLTVRKKAGRIANLEEAISGEKLFGTTGIGHTRWATHGSPTDTNAHPHMSGDGEIAIVHNGIIENYQEIKEELIREHGITFQSETDSEVIAQLLGVLYDGDLEKAVAEAVKRFEGAYTFVAVAKKQPDLMVAYRKDTPLVAGLGKDCNFLASDVTPLLRYLDEVYLINNGEMVVCTPDRIRIYDENRKLVSRDPLKITWSVEDAEKGGYQHFMLKEIHEQPKAVQETLSRRIDSKTGDIRLDGISLTMEDLQKLTKIVIVACGTAYHAGLVGKYLIEKFARIPVEVDIASEFRYRDPFVDEHTLFIAVSQSGETLDTLMSLREAKSKGARILSIVNVVGSSVARESDDVFYTWAGPEIAVASTKAYTTQLICFYLLALYMGRMKGTVSDDSYRMMMRELNALPEKIQRILDRSKDIEKLAELLYNRTQVFYIGRGLDSAVAYEGSLKLKEISYINSFAIAAGELKHGTIALMEPETTVIALATQDRLFDKMYSNIEEVKARHAHIVTLVKEGHDVKDISTEVITIPNCADEVAPVLSVVPLQLFAYYVARAKGENIDKPRNLAKSVTVE